MSMEYFAVVRDGTTPQGSGPITAISRWTVTRRVDAAGSWTLTMDAADAQAAQVTAKRSVDIYAYIDDGYQLVGGGIIERIERQVQQDGSEVLVVSGGDYMRELAMRTVADLETFSTTAYGLWTGITVGGQPCSACWCCQTGRVLAGTGTTTGNVYTSDDGGKTWTDRGQLGSATHVYSFTEYFRAGRWWRSRPTTARYLHRRTTAAPGRNGTRRAAPRASMTVRWRRRAI